MYALHLSCFFFGSLVATLRVAETFEKSHLSSPEVAPVIENAKFYYMDGYFLTHGMESARELSSQSAAAGKVRSSSINLKAHPKLLTSDFCHELFCPLHPSVLHHTSERRSSLHRYYHRKRI